MNGWLNVSRLSLLGVIPVLVTFGLLVEAKLWRPGTEFTITENVQIAEAHGWGRGRA